jgi:hypothetical protein
MSFLSVFSTPPPAAALFVPSDRFFLRLVPLSPDLPVLEQAELALEASAPFPPAQLYWGCCVSPDRTQALVYAAHRRRFSAEELAEWKRAELVVPEIVALLGPASARDSIVRVVERERSLYGAAWTKDAAWPVAISARTLLEKPDGAAIDAFTKELAAKAGVSASGAQLLRAAPKARREDDFLYLEQPEIGAGFVGPQLVKADADALDVREREFLAKRRDEKRRGDLIWKLLLGGAAAAALALAFELGAAGISLIAKMQRARTVAQAPLVQRLETANGLVGRIDDLSRRQLRFFEMLSAVNEVRPRSIQFTRTGSNGRIGLDIDGKTSIADDVSTYETALRAVPGIERVEVNDTRLREGMTTFMLKVSFKPDGVPLMATPPAPAPASEPATTGGAQ